MTWTFTNEKLHPDKPGLRPYEQLSCLIVRNGELLIRQWNCEHLVWDTEDGDDFFCEAKDVTQWMLLSDLFPRSPAVETPASPAKPLSWGDRLAQITQLRQEAHANLALAEQLAAELEAEQDGAYAARDRGLAGEGV